MSTMGLMVSIFPAVHLTAILASLVFFVIQPGLVTGLSIPFSIYALPLACFRIHRQIYGPPPRKADLSQKAYCSWWGDYNFQLLFNTFPAFERILRLVPPLFSGWLRLWQAQVGKGVFYTPHIEIMDRPDLVIGDDVCFGYQVSISSHAITEINGRKMLYFKPPEIGDHCFIGARSVIYPGAKLGPRVQLKFNTSVTMNESVEGPS
jgi:hypothetical protein